MCIIVQEVHNINSSAGIPYPFNTTINSAAYVGFEKLDDNRSLADYIKVSLSPERLYIAQYCICLSLKYALRIITSPWYGCEVL